MAAAASLLHECGLSGLARKGLDGFYGYGLGCMDCLDGMAWHGLGMDASMRVHAWAGLNQSLNDPMVGVFRYLGYNAYGVPFRCPCFQGW